MTGKKRKVCSIAALAVATFLWDWGLYAMTNAFVAKLFLVIILISGAWCYYELKHAVVVPPSDEENEISQTTEVPSESTDNEQPTIKEHKNRKP